MEPRHALILTYGDPKPGCEVASLALHGRSLDLLSRLEAAGQISHMHAWISLTGDRSARSGTLVVEGSRAQIQELFWSKEWKATLVHARTLLESVCLELAVGGHPASLTGPFGVYGEAVQSANRE